MKRMIKNPIFAFILGAIIFGGIGTVVAATILAKDVSYTPKDTTWKVDNVKDAIDDLYTKANKEILNKFTISIDSDSYSSTRIGRYDLNFSGSITDNYKYFKVLSVEKLGNTTKTCEIKAWSNAQLTMYNIELNKQYEMKSTADGYNFGTIVLDTLSTADGSRGWCGSVYRNRGRRVALVSQSYYV